MKLIQNISSTLKTWVFKKKILKFSEKFARDPQACFYCPEMCRFSCSVAETLKTNAVTPRGKMSLLHLTERGYSDERIAGSSEQRLWYLEQCTGCGRCTEFCVHEVDVASNLRDERSKVYAKLKQTHSGDVRQFDMNAEINNIAQWRGTVLLCEPGRKQWWENQKEVLAELSVDHIAEASQVARLWGQGKLGSDELKKLVVAFYKTSKAVKKIWIESPETAWFFAKGLIDDSGLSGFEVRTLWQGLYKRAVYEECGPETVWSESYYLTRLLPRLGYSIPMYEKGFLPFHSGWNAIDSGAESFFKDAYPDQAAEMGRRYLEDIQKDGRKIDKIICQSFDGANHLKELGAHQATYWLDEVLK